MTTIEDLRTKAALIFNAVLAGENTAKRVGSAFNDTVDLIEQLQKYTGGEGRFISKDKKDETKEFVAFLKGIGIGRLFDIDGDGNARLNSVTLAKFLRSANFNPSEQAGFGITQREDGKYQLSLTDIIVWGKAIFNELELRRLSYVGGNMVFSACGSKVTKVEDKGSTWRCYFRQDDGTTQTQNLWQTDDLARAETFNLKGKANRHYWRRVTSVGEDWIELSKTDCEQGSDAPQVDDALVQMGNRTKPERQGLIMLRTMGEQAIIIYSGINGYTLEGKSVALLSPSKVDISANIFRLLSPSGSVVDLKGKDGRDGKSSYTFTRYSDDGGKTFTKAIPLKATGELFAGRNIFALNAGLIAEAGAVLDSSINGVKCTKTKSLNRVGLLFKRFAGNLPRGQFRISGRMKTDGTTFSVNVNMGGVNAGDVIATSDWKAFSLVADRPGYSDAPNYCFVDFRYGMAQSSATALNLYVADLMITQGSEPYDYAPAPEDQQFGLTSGTYLGIASWDKPYPPLDPSVYTWSSTTDKEAMKKAQEAIKAAETANSAAASAATKASDATKRAGEVEIKMQQGEFIVRADKTRFQNNKRQDVAVFNADGTVNVEILDAKEIVTRGIQARTIDAKNATFENVNVKGILKGVSGSFSSLDCEDIYGKVVGSLGFDNHQNLTITNGDLKMEGRKEGRKVIFNAENIWCRGRFSAAARCTAVVLGERVKYYCNWGDPVEAYLPATHEWGTDRKIINLLCSFTNGMNSRYGRNYPIGLEDASIDTIIFAIPPGETYYYNICMEETQRVTIINAHDDANKVFVYLTNGQPKVINGGVCCQLIKLPIDYMTPIPRNAYAYGVGVVLMGETDNNWM